MFGQVDANGNPVNGTNEVSSTRVNKTDAAGWNANAGNRVSKLGYFGKKLGPNMMLKVMAGDEIAARTDYYYTGQPDNNVPNNILSSIVSSLFSSLSYGASSTNLYGTATNITTNINTTPGEFGTFLNNQNTNTDATPQAYMNVLFFDENFNFVPYDNVTGLGSYALRVTYSGDGQRILPQISKAPKNGYAFVYLSNESKTFVYFDNFEVTHVRGRLIEENAYYAYGLKIAGISSKAFDAPKNPCGYQADYSEFDDETQWNEFALRNYDPQIGRFVQADPYDQFPSPYTGMGNDPVNKVDPSGGWVFSAVPLIEHGAWAIGGAVAGTVIAWATSGWNANAMKQGAGIGFGAGLGASFVSWSTVGSAIGNAGSWVGNLFQQQPNWWILYEGQKAIFYEGKFGNQSKEIERYKASSGIITYKDPAGKKIDTDYRNSKYQFTKVKVNEDGEEKEISVGPIPEGNYSINLSLDPNRDWQLDKKGNSIPGTGIEQIGTNYPNWGTIRARLEIDPGTNTKGRDYFYFHNSRKGYSHGCVETEGNVFRKLYEYRKNGNPKIRLKVSYGSKINQLMAVLINKHFITTLLILSCLSVKAQDKVCIRLAENVYKKNFVTGDTIKFTVESIIKDTIHYHLEVLMHDGKEWIYSPYYTRYFNFELPYSKMVKMFSSKLPIIFSQDYKQQSKILLYHEIAKFYFVVEKQEKYRRLIRFRIHALEECSFIYSNSFYFARIKE